MHGGLLQFGDVLLGPMMSWVELISLLENENVMSDGFFHDQCIFLARVFIWLSD